MPSLVASGVLLVDLARRSGGAETRVVDTAIGLAAKGVPVCVVCLTGSPLAAAVRGAGLRVHAVAGSKRDPRLVVALRGLLRDHVGWVVDAHNAQSQLALHLAWMGKRPSRGVVATVHSVYRDSERRPLGLSAHEAVLRRTIRAGWGLVAVSTSVRDNLEQLGAAQGDIDVIWSGIPGHRGSRPGEDGAAVRDELGFSPTDFVVVAVGRMVAVKNFQLAIRAVHRLHESLPEARLLLVGDGPERPGLEKLARGLPGPADLVRFAGQRSDVPDLLAAADAMVITSTTEGLPYVLLEAAAAGTPVVSTSVGAIPEIFGDEAVTLLPAGVERQPRGASLLAEELLSLASQPLRRRQMTTRAAAIQRHNLNLDAMLTSTLRAYHSSLGGATVPTATILGSRA